MIRIIVKPARRIFGGRRQWRFEIRAANGRKIDPRDTYVNVGDIKTIARKLLTIGGDSVVLEVHHRDGFVETERLR